MRTAGGARCVLLHLGAALAVMLCGLVWRLVPMGLPGFYLKYGGSVLWGAMVLLLVGTATGGNRRWWVAPLAAAGIALASELFRLYHAPALDAFRTTLAGALLLGRVFSGWNLVAYVLGIALALPLHQWITQAARGREMAEPRPDR